jgi:hypothetical protein
MGRQRYPKARGSDDHGGLRWLQRCARPWKVECAPDTRTYEKGIDAAGLPDDCVLHGLPKLTAKMLAEAGNSPHLIGSITGHDPQSPEIARYTRQAVQRKMATAAILSLEPNAKRTRTAKRTPGKSAKHSAEA